MSHSNKFYPKYLVPFCEKGSVTRQFPDPHCTTKSSPFTWGRCLPICPQLPVSSTPYKTDKWRSPNNKKEVSNQSLPKKYLHTVVNCLNWFPFPQSPSNPSKFLTKVFGLNCQLPLRLNTKMQLLLKILSKTLTG